MYFNSRTSAGKTVGNGSATNFSRIIFPSTHAHFPVCLIRVSSSLSFESCSGNFDPRGPVLFFLIENKSPPINLRDAGLLACLYVIKRRYVINNFLYNFKLFRVGNGKKKWLIIIFVKLPIGKRLRKLDGIGRIYLPCYFVSLRIIDRFKDNGCSDLSSLRCFL